MKMRVVTESVPATRLEGDDTLEVPPCLGENPAVRGRETHRADEPSGPGRFGNPPQGFDELSIVGSVTFLPSSVDSGPTGAPDPRLSAQCIDFKSGIVGECVSTGCPCVGDRLDPGIALEGRGILDRLLRNRRELVETQDVDSQRTENRPDLLQFVRISTGEENFFQRFLPEGAEGRERSRDRIV